MYWMLLLSDVYLYNSYLIKMSRCIGSLFALDFLSKPIGLNVRGQPTVRTKVGTALSVVCLTLFASLSWVIVQNYMDTSRPVISYETQFMSVKELVDVKKSKMYPILFFVRNDVEFLSPEEISKYVHPVIAHIVYKKDEDGNEYQVATHLKMVPCKELIARGKTDTIVADTEGYVKTTYPKHGYCVDDEGQRITLGGEEVKHDWEAFEVVLYPCIQTDGSCKTAAQLAEFSSLITFPTPVTNFGNYKSPIKHLNDDNEFFGLSSSLSVVHYHNMRENKVMEERGFLSKLEVTHSFVSTEKSSMTIRARDPTATSCPNFDLISCSPYVMHVFMLTNNQMKVVRSYKGIVESISEIGGMVDLVYIVSVFLYSAYHAAAAKAYLVREVYGIAKPRSKFALFSKKTLASLPPDGAAGLDLHEQYRKAGERLDKDLDLVRILEEINTLKFFVLTSASGSSAAPNKPNLLLWLESNRQIGTDSASTPYTSVSAILPAHSKPAPDVKQSRSPLFSTPNKKKSLSRFQKQAVLKPQMLQGESDSKKETAQLVDDHSSQINRPGFMA